MWGLRFSERMSGWISFSDARFGDTEERPFEIQIFVFTGSLFSPFVKREVRGTARVIGKPDLGGELTGSIQINPRGVAYDFIVKPATKPAYRVLGAKTYAWGTLSLQKFIKSLITLPLQVVTESEPSSPIGRAELVYRDALWKFILPFRIVRDRYAFDDRIKYSNNILKLVPYFVEKPEQYIDSHELLKWIHLQVSGFGRMSMWGLRTSLLCITFLKTFLTVERALASPIFRILFLPINSIVLSSVFAGREFLKSKDQNLPEPPKDNEPQRWMSLIFAPTRAQSKTPIEVDAVVVGSGAGGAAAAETLARQGLAVAIVEEGNYFQRTDFSGHRIEMMNKIFRDRGFTFPLSNSPIWLPTGKGVGGTTTINSGTAFRPRDATLGLPEVNLEPYFTQVEQVLDVKRTPEHLATKLYKFVKSSLPSSYETELLPRAETGCDGQSHCIFGCPTGAKRSTDVSYIPEALKSHAHLYTNYEVREVLFDGQRAVGVRARVPGFDAEFTLEIRARAVILAMGALKTPALLSRLPAVRHRKWLGRRLSIHPALVVGAQYAEPIRQRFFVPQAIGAFSTQHSDYVLEGYTLSVDAVPISLMLRKQDLSQVMNHIDKFTNFSGMISDAKYGRLLLWGKTFAIPFYWISKKTVRRIQDSAAVIMEMFLKSGATAVFSPIFGFEKITSLTQVETFRKMKLSAHNVLSLSAHHPLGTAAMGTSPRSSATDQQGRPWGTDGLYVVDGSAIPGPLGINPQVTIMANATRIASEIAKTL